MKAPPTLISRIKTSVVPIQVYQRVYVFENSYYDTWESVESEENFKNLW